MARRSSTGRKPKPRARRNRTGAPSRRVVTTRRKGPDIFRPEVGRSFDGLLHKRSHGGEYDVSGLDLALPHGMRLGMGPLSELWVRRHGRKRSEVWRFRPYPRLFYDESDGKRRLFVVGGGYRVTPSGIVQDGPVGLSVRSARGTKHILRREREHYKKTHGGLEPKELVEGHIVIPDDMVILGTAEKIAYKTDRNLPYRRPGCHSEACEETGVFNWRHEFGEEAFLFGGEKPLVLVDREGKNITLLGGDYSVDGGWIVG